MAYRRRRRSANGRKGDGVWSYLRRAVRRIARRLQPERIILFGSYAYGRPDPDSDVDLLVIMRSREHPFDRANRVDDLLEDRPVAMDILVRTPKEIAEYRKGFHPFWEEVLGKGKILYAARR